MFGVERIDNRLASIERRFDRYFEELKRVSEALPKIDGLRKRVYLLENPAEAEKERIHKLQEKVDRGYRNYGWYESDNYSDEDIKKWSKEIASYYAKKAKER